MGALEPDRPRSDRWPGSSGGCGAAITRRIVADAAALRADGKRVCLVTPDAADLAVMGVNLMDPLAPRGRVRERRARPSAAISWPRAGVGESALGGTAGA